MKSPDARKRLPGGWNEAPHFGLAMLGSMRYQADSTIQLQVFHADSMTPRGDTYGGAA